MHRYLAIVIEFENDEELVDAQRAGTINEATRQLALELEPEGGGGIHVHMLAYRVAPHHYSPYNTPMTIPNLYLPTSTRWSDGTGGRNPEGGGRGAD